MIERRMIERREADPADSRVMTGAAWTELCESLARAGERVLGEDVPDTPRDRAEGFRYLARFLASGLATCVNHDDPDYPLFGRMIEYARPWGLDNPDCLYLYAPLRGGAAYRVWGRRGSANHLDIQVNSGHYADGDLASLRTIASLDGSQLETGQSGELELRIGGAARDGNWLPSADDAEFLLVRQYFNDWDAEEPADLFIERIGASYPIPPPRTDWVAERLAKLGRWMENGGSLWENMSNGFLNMERNSIVVHMPDAAGERTGMRGQAYGMGNFACAEDEAVVLEFRPPRCRHWGVALANRWWECVEYASRQCSLNGAQATLDGDGVFRAVIAHEDPAVPNWLDPAGNARGTLSVRFLDADSAPEVRIRRVPLRELAGVLPADTPHVDAAARARTLERRRHAVLARHRR